MSTKPGEVQVAAARHVLGGGTLDDLRAAADATLNDGIYTPSLADLAFPSSRDQRNADELLRGALTELAVKMPSVDDAFETLAIDALSRVVAGAVSPRQGLGELVNAYNRLPEREEEYAGSAWGVAGLIGDFYSYDELEERPTEVSFRGAFGPVAVAGLDAAVTESAREWLAARGE